MQTKSAIVTGASKGIGRAVAKHLASRGYNLLLISRSQDLLNELKTEILTAHNNTYIATAAIDIFQEAEVKHTVDEFNKATSSVDLVFNNAGYVKRGTSDIDNVELLKMINTNLIGAINIVKAALPIMQKQNSGYIINISSRSAKICRSALGGYAASKAALLAYNESLYKDLKNTNIKVTALCPGLVNTDMTADLKEDRSKLIQPEDFSTIIDFLLTLSPSIALKELSFESIVQIGTC